MKLLITNHWLKKLAGSETFTYTLGSALKKAGHNVDLFTNVKGLVSNRMLTDLGIHTINADTNKKYDLILANHNSTVPLVHQKGFTIQTCHGTLPALEQPDARANLHVSISEEVQEHLQKNGIKSTVIRNGIDCKRYMPFLPIHNKVTSVLSFGNTEEFNQKIAQYFAKKGIRFISHNKFTNPRWDTENIINQVDIGLWTACNYTRPSPLPGRNGRRVTYPRKCRRSN
jgi:hypothetical protein